MSTTLGKKGAGSVRPGRVAMAMVAAMGGFLLNPLAAAQTAPAATAIAAPALTLDADPAPLPAWIHGYVDNRLATAHLSPRGLMTVDQGVVWQPAMGLVFDLFHLEGPIDRVSLVTTGWFDFNSHHRNTTAWQEFDGGVGLQVVFLKNFTATANWSAWAFPNGHPATMYNTDLKLSFNDEGVLKQVALHPYVDLFWNYEGASPVKFGTSPAMYAELGIEPQYVLHLGQYPVTFKFPTYGSVGDSSFWGNGHGHTERSNLGVLSTGIKATFPLTGVPEKFGKWSVYVGGQYIHTCNPSLTYANQVCGAGSTHERFAGYTGLILMF